VCLQEKGVGVTYKNLRLVSTRVDWQWEGEVHEFVQRKDGRHNEQQDIDGLWFHHDASGGQEGKRFVRDEVILAKVCAALSWPVLSCPAWPPSALSALLCCILSRRHVHLPV
jgi:hypothetical protein